MMKRGMSLTIVASAMATAAFTQNTADFERTASNGAATITGYKRRNHRDYWHGVRRGNPETLRMST